MTDRTTDRRRLFTASLLVLAAAGCSAPTGPARLNRSEARPAPKARPSYGYVMSAQANAMLVIDASTHTIVKKVKHPDLVRPANGYGPAYGVYTTPDKRTLYLTLGPPAQERWSPLTPRHSQSSPTSWTRISTSHARYAFRTTEPRVTWVFDVGNEP